MQSFQQRVVDEKTELDAKIQRLGAFFQTSGFRELGCDEQTLLRMQHVAMKSYSAILGERIAKF